MELVLSNLPFIVLGVIVVILLLILLSRSYHKIGPNEVGLVTKNFGKKLPQGALIAMNGEAGYQPDLLMPGWRYKPWPIYKVKRYDRVQIPVDGIGVVVAQVGRPLDSGAKTAVYTDALGDFSDVRQFISNDGQRGVQRPIIPPGTVLPIHPIAFVVITKAHTFGEFLSEDMGDIKRSLSEAQLSVVNIAPPSDKVDQKGNKGSDVVGIVTVQDGPPLPSGDIAGRLGGFEDIANKEHEDGVKAEAIIQMLLGTKNDLHNNYQDFQAFLAHGGRMGLQHDPLLYGTYLLNPFLVKVEIVPMLVVEQGEVAVIKSYVGLPSEDTSGEDYKFGSIVAPGHRGIWEESLRTGKYPLNPRIYQAEIVPTSILTLNWADATSTAHDLDAELSSIDAMSKEAFQFKIDLQVQIHVPDTKASKVIGMVGTMQNLVNEVLQSAVGNYFRNALQKLAATKFIETRGEVQEEASVYVTEYLMRYDVEVRGVYIQDVELPAQLVTVLTAREIAAQQIATYESEQKAEQARVSLESQKGEADAQRVLAEARVSVEVNESKAKASIAEAEGQAKVITLNGEAEATKIAAIGKANAGAVEALGLANAASFEAQSKAFGPDATAAVAVMREIASGGIKITPDTLVGGDNSGGLGGLVSLMLTKMVTEEKDKPAPVEAPAAPAGSAEPTHTEGTVKVPDVTPPAPVVEADSSAADVESRHEEAAAQAASSPAEAPDTAPRGRRSRKSQ